MRLITNIDNIQIEVCHDLQLADTLWTRFWGLMWKKSLPEGKGLLLKPCNGIHTFFMKFAIDALFINKQNEIIDVIAGLKPYRFTLPRFKSHSVVELPEGSIKKKGLRVGMELVFV